MKRLTLLRHAKAGMDAPNVRDVDRSLNAKGHRAARVVGRHLAERGLTFDHVVASPATRVRETLDGVAEGYGRPLDPAWDKRIYLASAATLLDVIHDAPDGAETLLLVGHNPGMEDLVLLLVPDGEGPRDEVEVKYPTASLAELSFEVGSWAEVAAGGATLDRFTRPRDLDPSLGPESD